GLDERIDQARVDAARPRPLHAHLAVGRLVDRDNHDIARRLRIAGSNGRKAIVEAPFDPLRGSRRADDEACRQTAQRNERERPGADDAAFREKESPQPPGRQIRQRSDSTIARYGSSGVTVRSSMTVRNSRLNRFVAVQLRSPCFWANSY